LCPAAAERYGSFDSNAGRLAASSLRMTGGSANHFGSSLLDVEVGVGGAEKVFDIHSRRVGGDAATQTQSVFPMFAEVPAFNQLIQALDCDARLDQVRVRHDDQELVAAETDDDVGSAKILLQQ